MLSRDALASRFPWPTPPGATAPPRWTGAGFQLDGHDDGVLSYLREPSGWSDDLTAMHEAEAGADHPIDIASRERAVRELRRHLHGDASTIVDVGCSSGYMLHDLRRAFPEALLIGADYVGGPLQNLARTQPDLPLLQIDLTRCPLPDASVDALVALNVLEHIEDDAEAVRQIYRVLKPRGVAYIELPAGPALYDVHDKALMHCRRYTRRGAVRLFERAGFAVERLTHLGFLVWPAFVAVKLRNKRHLAASEAKQREILEKSIRQTRVSPAMALAMRAETAVAELVRFPVGVRVVLTAVKK
jgi:ubiquinone/menaquinone biosynthesis C-methylase UbiE